jgi:transcriptional regulator with XRE-family HTH domain
VSKSTHTAKYDEFRRLLTEARKNAGMNQRELAKRLDMPHSTVGRMEVGDRRVDIIELVEISEILGVDLITFIKTLLRNIKSQNLSDKPARRRAPARKP